MPENPSCPACGGPLIQKSRTKLIVTGLCMSASLVAAIFIPLLLVPAIILTLAGLYLFAWGTIGKGRWCRNCKRFVVSNPK